MEANVRVGTLLPAEDRPAGPGGSLLPLEVEMIACAAAGELVDRGAGPSDLAEMQAWGQERTVRAEVLQHLLIAGLWPVHAKGVRLRGVRISGHLDLKRLPSPVRCRWMAATSTPVGVHPLTTPQPRLSP